MARAAIPTPLVRASTIGQARPAGAALPELWRLFLAHCDAQVRAGALSPSRLSQLKTTARRCAGLPEFPEQAHVRQWLDAMAGKPTTRKGEFWNLHSCYAWGLASNHVAYNPCFRLRYKVPAPKRHAILDVYEKWPRMLACCDVLALRTHKASRAAASDAVRGRALLGVLRFGGLRIGEALALEVPCVETWRAPWRLQVRQQRSEHSLEVTPRLKNEHSRRPVDVHREARALLEPVLQLGGATAWVGAGGAQCVQTSLLFPFRTSQLERLMGALRAELPGDFPADDAWHVFRHTCAVDLRRRGIEVDVVSKFLGHESVHYTQGYLRGFMGSEGAAGIFEGIEGPPPWAPAAGVVAARAATTAAPGLTAVSPGDLQATLKLGPLNAVRGGRKRGAEGKTTTRVAARVVAQPGGSNPGESVETQQLKPAVQRKAVSL